MNHIAKFFLISIFFFETSLAFASQNVALCTVATGKYAFFVKNFVESARKNFLPEHNLKIFVFTDKVLSIEGEDVVQIRWPHKKWPFSTMMRFKAYHEHAYLFNEMDYVFACDIDAIFVNSINNEILGDLVGVLHPGYYKKDLINTGIINGLIEKNSNSTIYMNLKTANKEYFAGGFYGGKTEFFKKMVESCYSSIVSDLKSDIIAAWHDETHLNYYFLHNLPEIKLSPSYCYPEEAEKSYTYRNVLSEEPKILMLNKNHIHMRSEEHFLDDREFVILIPSYNNIKYYKTNLDSVYRQVYKKYRVIYIDDNSSDGTGEAVSRYVSELGKENITTIVKNQDRKLALANIYNNIHQYCMDHEIIVMLDGDDELSNQAVLSRLNDEYKKNDIWFTYGNCWFSAINKVCSWSKKISDNNIEQNGFREWDGAATHLRTFYTWLFKRVKKSDLMMDGDFFKMTYDVAMFMPMLEMSGYHHKFIEEVLYDYNDENPLNDHKVNSGLQMYLNKYIRNHLSKYQPITKMEFFDKILKNDLDENTVNIIEIAAILNDFIIEICNIYPEEEALDIFSKITCLQDDFIKKYELARIVEFNCYNCLGNYLIKKHISNLIGNNSVVNINFDKNTYYLNELVSDVNLTEDKIKFSQWLGNLISKRYGLMLTNITNDVNKINKQGSSPLMTASAEGLPDMVLSLLYYGADRDMIHGKDNKTAVDFARGRKEPWFSEIIEILSN